jgi:predicted cation transporter
MNPWLALALLVLLLLGPLLLAPLERNIEWLFLSLGILAAMAARRLDLPLVLHALREPWPISLSVVIAGSLFSRGQTTLAGGLAWLAKRIPRAVLVALLTFVIAMIASAVTAIVAALAFAEMIQLLGLQGAQRRRTAVAGCFAIGLGAALTPLGEPLATLATSALKLEMLGLMRLLGLYLLPGILVCSLLAGLCAGRAQGVRNVPLRSKSLAGSMLEGVRIYAFVAGLVLIGAAFAPLAGPRMAQLSPALLYWGNMISAAADNATLVAVELHGLSAMQARPALIALLVSGGMLIPGNVPNIICAAQLELGSRQWARSGIPLGLLLLLAYFVAVG